jgi:hypothetical protein
MLSAVVVNVATNAVTFVSYDTEVEMVFAFSSMVAAANGLIFRTACGDD